MTHHNVWALWTLELNIPCSDHSCRWEGSQAARLWSVWLCCYGSANDMLLVRVVTSSAGKKLWSLSTFSLTAYIRYTNFWWSNVVRKEKYRFCGCTSAKKTCVFHKTVWQVEETVFWWFFRFNIALADGTSGFFLISSTQIHTIYWLKTQDLDSSCLHCDYRSLLQTKKKLGLQAPWQIPSPNRSEQLFSLNTIITILIIIPSKAVKNHIKSPSNQHWLTDDQ